jgi:hypothetical protein
MLHENMQAIPGALTAVSNCSLLNSFLPWLSPIICADDLWPAVEEVMENFAELMQRLLEIQSGGRQRSPELIAEKRLMDGLQRNVAGSLPQAVKLTAKASAGATKGLSCFS